MVKSQKNRQKEPKRLDKFCKGAILCPCSRLTEVKRKNGLNKKQEKFRKELEKIKRDAILYLVLRLLSKGGGKQRLI